MEAVKKKIGHPWPVIHPWKTIFLTVKSYCFLLDGGAVSSKSSGSTFPEVYPVIV